MSYIEFNDLYEDLNDLVRTNRQTLHYELGRVILICVSCIFG